MMDITGISSGVSAAVLAGGKNSRIATEKSLLRIGDIPLIENTLRLLEPFFQEILIITGKEAIKERFPQYQHSEDRFRDAGPLAGIHSALKAASNDAVFVFACDMPYLNANLIGRMLAYYKENRDNLALLVPSHSSGFEPLHAIYRKITIPVVEKQLKSKNYKISDFFAQVTTASYHVSDVDIAIFYNINTKEDYERLKLQRNQF